jgi:predicted DNA-binding ribbon-helix-helix protein
MGHRTQITLSDEQYERLQAEARRSGLGIDELVQRALDRTYGNQIAQDVLSALEASFGSWTDRPDDGAAYVEELRRGMASRLNR